MSVGYSHILVPVDGSDASEAAAEHAIDLATRYDAGVTVMHVVDDDLLPLDARSQQLVERLEAEAADIVTEVVEWATEAGVMPIERRIVRGSPADEILTAIDEKDVDLVVLGSHGRSGIDKFIMGSVSERVVRQSPVPVLTVRS
ncbi:universal stress protein [Haloarchaeobius amylolyticus]|uniref:universal stress protein n=1 Tax=Haloarchaeobius amylolyticus TaxID=1198296 RepID=UPI00226DEF41|nr:universal stress protein [Haloarchaeobius amylolyticus]